MGPRLVTAKAQPFAGPRNNWRLRKSKYTMAFMSRFLINYFSRLSPAAALLLAVALAPMVAAQQPEASAIEEAQTVPPTNGAIVDIYRGQGARAIPDDVIDEIIVVAPRSRFMIEEDIRQADIALYSVFNSLNDDRRYNVYCDWEDRNDSQMGSRLKRHVCRPAFEEGIDTFQFGGPGDSINIDNSINRSAGEIERDRQKLAEKMAALAEKHPELTRAIIERAVLEREKRRSGRRNTE